MDLYLSLLPAVFAVIPVRYTIAATLHESPLAIEYLLYSLLGSLLEGLLESPLESLLERATFERAVLREE
jgi:sorbitol-specific phosphotransferase system component IIC